MGESDENDTGPDQGADADPVAVAREIALRQLDVRARSRAELQRAMAKKHVPEAAAAEVLDRFAEVGLIDDAAFAEQWIASGERRMRGKAVLRQELRQKGVDAETVEAVLTGRDSDDREVALRFAVRKARSLAGLERAVAYRRLCGALARRGFAPSVVASVAAEVLREHFGGAAGFEDDQM